MRIRLRTLAFLLPNTFTILIKASVKLQSDIYIFVYHLFSKLLGTTAQVVGAPGPSIKFFHEKENEYRTPNVNDNGWNNTDVTVNWSCSDNVSGVEPDNVSKTVSTEGADQTAPGTCEDIAGNKASDAQGDINIDKTAPVVSVTGVTDGTKYILGSVPASVCSTTDAPSGVAIEATLSSTGGPVGLITTTCSDAQDNAGNPGSVSVTYSVIYDWTGFFAPVDNLPNNYLTISY